MSNKKIMVEDIIDGAICQGFKSGTNSFVESIELELQNDIVLQEAGGAEIALQKMINKEVTILESKEAKERATDIKQKLSKIIK